MKGPVSFTLFTPKLSPFGVGGHEITTPCPTTLQMLHTKVGKDWPISFSSEDVNRRRIAHADGPQPKAIGHLSDLIGFMQVT